MKVLNIGSINIDHVYAVDHFVRPGETLHSKGYQIFAGGKGFNQSVALARAGVRTLHAGAVGKDGMWLLDRLSREGVDTTQVVVSDAPTGHAIIQVISGGENAILLDSGANRLIKDGDVTSALSSCTKNDVLLLQNEANLVAWAIQKGHERGLRVVFNAAPITDDVHHYPLDLVDLFILNETEAEYLTGECTPSGVRKRMSELYPNAGTVLTQGSAGAMYFDSTSSYCELAREVDAVDATAAGDTFTGFFLAKLIESGKPKEALAHGCRAAEICVTRHGASDSIPELHDLK